ncbi:MAG: ABC transporter permease [Clostridia bacterium]|jgi:ABC-2 type transport system permease protein|nr:ABC transporter permease [Clostridia bacterium]
MLIFWTFAFPIILGTLFNMAFSNIENSEKLDIINIAIINNDDFENNEAFKTSFEELSDENNEDRLFNTQYTTEEKAKELLDNGEIVGYMKLKEDKPILTFATSGINETIFKYVTEEIEQTSDIIKNLSETETQKQITSGNYNINYEEIYNKVIELAKEDKVKLKNISNSNLSYTMIEFYTLIAMTCLYGGMLSMVSINQTLANMSNKGKRIAVSPTKKGTIILSSLLASYIAQLIGLAILFVYTLFVLKVDYGDNTSLIILLAMIGSFAGLTLGTFVGTLFKTNENAKTGILIALTMFWCYLSGMMGITMKYVVDKNVPIINKINPASMITDGLYSLYYYDTFDRYWFNIISLLIFAFVLMLISFFSLRRQKYDSI